MTDQQLAAAQLMHHTLTLMPCACSVYDQWRKAVNKDFELKVCYRCKAIQAWEAVQKVTTP